MNINRLLIISLSAGVALMPTATAKPQKSKRAECMLDLEGATANLTCYCELSAKP